MLWVTREYLHLDRVATPWLIKRFVDKDAVFCYVPWGQEEKAPKEAIPFAIPGAALSQPASGGSAFGQVLKTYNIHDVALARINKIIDAGIAYTLKGYRPDAMDYEGQVAVGLLAFAEGVIFTNQTDDSILTASFPVYDALYANFSVEHEMKTRAISLAHKPGDGRGPSQKFEVGRDVYNKYVLAV